MNKLILTASAAFFALTGAANAATLTINSDTVGTIPNGSQTNEIVEDLHGSGATLDGFFGSSISIDTDARVLVKFFGFEAGFENSFVLGGGSFDSEDYDSNEVLPSDLRADGGIPSFLANVMEGVFAFTFNTNDPNSPFSGSVSNGDANSNDNGNPNFFATFGNGVTKSGNRLWLFFDDGGAPGDDDNHDDFAIMITTVVPLPGAALPLLTAMAGLGWIGRRRRNAAKV